MASPTRSTSTSVKGSDMRVVEMIPGYTHSITNLSDTEGPRDGHVGQRALRPREPRHLPRGGLAAWRGTVPISNSRTTAA